MSGLGSLPVAAGLLVGLNGLYILLAAFGNITDFDTNRAFVRHELAMDTTNSGAPQGTGLDSDVMWRAITNKTLQDIAYIVIITWDRIAATVLTSAVYHRIRERGAGYRTARALSTVGLLILVLLFPGGFIVIGGKWFQMWKSDLWNGLEPAFRNSVLAMIALALVHQPSPHWTTENA